MKPSEAIEAIGRLRGEQLKARQRAADLDRAEVEIMTRLDAGEDIAMLGERAEILLRGDDPDIPIQCDSVCLISKDMSFAPQRGTVDAPYGRRTDGSPKARPGRKAKEAPSREEVERAGKIIPIDTTGAGIDPLSPDERHNAVLINAAAKAPVDEAKNAAELRAIRGALECGPLTIDELVMNSGVSRTDVLRHLAAGAVIEEYTGVRDEKLDPLPLVRLISQRPS